MQLISPSGYSLVFISLLKTPSSHVLMYTQGFNVGLYSKTKTVEHFSSSNDASAWFRIIFFKLAQICQLFSKSKNLLVIL